MKSVGDTVGVIDGVAVGFKLVGLQLGGILCDFMVGPALRVLVGITNVGDTVGMEDGLRLVASVTSVGAVVGGKFWSFVLVDIGSLIENRENVRICVGLVVGSEDVGFRVGRTVFEAFVGEVEAFLGEVEAFEGKVEGDAFNGFNLLPEIVGDFESDDVKIGKPVPSSMKYSVPLLFDSM